MSGETQLLLMVALVHLLGLASVVVLVVFALRQGSRDGTRRESGSDDGWGNDRPRPRQPSDRPWGGVPLPDATRSRVRLRDDRKLSDRLPPHERRPAREPARTPAHS